MKIITRNSTVKGFEFCCKRLGAEFTRPNSMIFRVSCSMSPTKLPAQVFLIATMVNNIVNGISDSTVDLIIERCPFCGAHIEHVNLTKIQERMTVTRAQ